MRVALAVILINRSAEHARVSTLEVLRVFLRPLVTGDEAVPNAVDALTRDAPKIRTGVGNRTNRRRNVAVVGAFSASGFAYLSVVATD